jgi:hypothetical protein
MQLALLANPIATVGLWAVALCLASTAQAAPAQSQAPNVSAWGFNGFGQCTVPALPPGLRYDSVAGGIDHSLALRSDGAVVAWGDNFYGQCAVPALPPGARYLSVAGGHFHSLALRSDGAVVAWGENGLGECNVPALPPGLRYEAAAGGFYHSLALRSDGAVVAWGSNGSGQCVVPALPPGVRYQSTAAGYRHSLALRSDGAIRALGDNTSGQCVVPPLPAGARYEAVAARLIHSLAIRSDGSALAWGDNFAGQCVVPPLAPGWRYASIAGGGYHSLASTREIDCDQNGIGDLVDLANGAPDCDGDLVLDVCEVDANADTVPDDCQSGGTPYCFGVGPAGGGTACPCGNIGTAGNGCPNAQNANGARLEASGLPSRVADSFVLHGSGMPTTATVLYFQGTVQSNGFAFGDGLRCANGFIARLGYRVNVNGASQIPSGGSTPLHIAGQIPAVGAATRYYQGWYRDAAANFCTTSRFNLTNGVAVVWVP